MLRDFERNTPNKLLKMGPLVPKSDSESIYITFLIRITPLRAEHGASSGQQQHTMGHQLFS